MNILEFVDSELNGTYGYELWSVQRIILKSIYDIPLDDTDPCVRIPKGWMCVGRGDRSYHNFTEKEYLQYLHHRGRTNLTESTAADTVVLVAGRRTGKTTLCKIMGLFEVYQLLQMDDPHSDFSIPGHSDIGVSFVVHSGRTARDVKEDVKKRTVSSNFLVDRSASTSPNGLKFDHPKEGSVEMSFRKSSYRSISGISQKAVFLDEVDYYGGDSRRGYEIFQACQPTMLLADGAPTKMVFASTPYHQKGILFDKYKESFGSDDIAMFQVPTWELNPHVDRERYKDWFESVPDTFHREFGASFGGIY